MHRKLTHQKIFIIVDRVLQKCFSSLQKLSKFDDKSIYKIIVVCLSITEDQQERFDLKTQDAVFLATDR